MFSERKQVLPKALGSSLQRNLAKRPRPHYSSGVCRSGGEPTDNGELRRAVPDRRRGGDPWDQPPPTAVLGSDEARGAERENTRGPRQVHIRGPGGSQGRKKIDRCWCIGPADSEIDPFSERHAAGGATPLGRAHARRNGRRRTRLQGRHSFRRSLRSGVGARGRSLPPRDRGLENLERARTTILPRNTRGPRCGRPTHIAQLLSLKPLEIRVVCDHTAQPGSGWGGFVGTCRHGPPAPEGGFRCE